MDRRRENHQRREEKRRKGEDSQSVRGVNLDAIRLTDPKDLPDVMEQEELKAVSRRSTRLYSGRNSLDR